MSHPTEIFAATGATVIGWFTGVKVADVVAQTVVTPDWASTLLGPMGALVGVLVALKWMAGRLNRAEEREEARQIQRAIEAKEERAVLIGLIRDVQSVTTSAVTVMEDVKDALQYRERSSSNHSEPN